MRLARLLGHAPEARAWETNPTLAALLGPDARSASSANAAQARSYDGAKAHSAVYACVDLICRLVSTMPVDEYRQGVQVRPSPLVARPSPDPWMPAAGWRRQVLESWLLRGYAAGLVVAERSGYPEAIEIVHPDQVSWRRDGGQVVWLLDGAQVGTWWEGTGPLWVAPSIHTTPGLPVGASVLRYAASSIALGLAAQRFGGDWFEHGATPSGVLSIDTADPIPKALADEIKARFKEATARREPVVVNKVSGYQQVQVAPEESQFLETIRANQAVVCSFFGVPPESIGASSGDSMTYATVEGRNLHLLVHTIGVWVSWFEASIGMLLPPGSSIKVVPDALLRTSTKTRYEAHAIALHSGFKTPNEVRELEELPPVEGGDTLNWPPRPSPSTTPAEGGQQR